jgi:hypothetical protein
MQFIREECANHQPDGSCAGVAINRDRTIPYAAPKPRCLITEGRRCAYFERCVVPMCDWTTEPRRKAAIQEAVAAYRRLTKQGEDVSRQCPDCDGPMARGNRYCPECAGKRRKLTYRKKNDRRRITMTTVVPENGSISPIIQRDILPVYRNPIDDSHPPRNARLTVVNGRLP